MTAQHTVTIEGDEIWFDGERVATIRAGLSQTTRDRLTVAIEGVEVRTQDTWRDGRVFTRYEGDA